MFIFGLTANKTTGRCEFHVTWALNWGAAKRAFQVPEGR
jgi:hypothetical protein